MIREIEKEKVKNFKMSYSNIRPKGGYRYSLKTMRGSSPNSFKNYGGKRRMYQRQNAMNQSRGTNRYNVGYYGRYPTGLRTSPEMKFFDTTISGIGNTTGYLVAGSWLGNVYYT